MSLSRKMLEEFKLFGTIVKKFGPILDCEYNASTSRCASTPPYKDWIYWFIKTCEIFAVLTDNLMLTNSFTNNVYDLPYRPHNPDIEVAYP